MSKLNALFKGLEKSIPYKSITRVSTPVFACVRLSSWLTLVGACVITARSFIGKNIACIISTGSQSQKAINTYCFINAVFTLPKAEDLENTPVEDIGPGGGGMVQPHPGVGPQSEDEGEVVHAYYQWVPFVLLMQAIVLYIPWYLWKAQENGYLSLVVGNMDKIHIGGVRPQLLKSSASFFVEHMGRHRRYALLCLVCEALGVALTIGNIFFTNFFLGGAFLSYGPDTFHYLLRPSSEYSLENPLHKVFPKVAKCTWRVFGPSGTVQVFDNMCVLPINIANEKVYVFLWFAYVILACIALLAFAIHIFFVVSHLCRVKYLASLSLLRHRADQKSLARLLEMDSSYGHWFVVHHIQRHLIYFKEWTEAVVEAKMK